MKIVCIGAGRLAHHLMPELQHAGCQITQVYNRTNWPAVLLARKLHSPDHITDLKHINREADFYFLTLSDDAIKDVAHQLESIHTIQGIGVHCSGVLGIDILPFDHRGIFYPLQTFSEDHEVEWRQTPIIISSDDKEDAKKIKNLAWKISSSVFEMSDEQKTIVHLAAVFANNFTNHMLSLAEIICKQNNVPFDILKPLIETTFQKAIEIGPSNSQTGPAIRGDEATIEKHIQLLEKYPELIEVYRIITKSIMNP